MHFFKGLPLFFLAGLACTLAVPVFFPSLKLFYFIPFLVRSFYLKPLKTSLWYAFFIGCILDLLSAHMRLGLFAFNYVATTYFLYGVKRHFFEDSLTTLPVMTFFFSVVSSLLQWGALLLFERQLLPLSLQFLLIDFLLMPFGDSLFALLAFTLPIALFGKPTRKGSDYFMEMKS